MRAFSIGLLLLITTQSLGAEDTWAPRVSLDETWRWTKLERLRDYNIITAEKGLNGDVWFAHKEGLLKFDGYEFENHPIPDLKSKRIFNLTTVDDEHFIITAQNSLIIWDHGKVKVIPCPENSDFTRNKVIQSSRGNLFVGTDKSVFQIQDDRLIELNIEVGNFPSILLDSNNNLWVSSAGGYPTKVYRLTELAGQTLAQLIHSFNPPAKNKYPPKLFMDSMKRVWVIDPDENDQCYLFDNYQKKPAIKGLREQVQFFDSLDIVETTQAEIWFCNSRRLARWDGSSMEVFSIEDYPIPSSYPYLIELAGNRLLLGGQRLFPRIINLSKRRWATYKGLNFQCEDKQGGWWFLAKDRRVVRYDGESWEAFSPNDDIIDRANRIFVSSDGRIWVSGAHGNQAAVCLYDDMNWYSYVFPDAGKTFSHLAVIETSTGDIIFGAGTPGNDLGDSPGGAVIFSKNDGGYKAAHYPPPTFLPRTANLVEREGDGLIASEGFIAKLKSLDAYINEANILFSNQWIDHMIVDQHNNLWIAGLGAGVYHHDGESWKMHGYAEGLATKNAIYLLEDKQQGKIIALTDMGLFNYDGRSWTKWGFSLDFPFRRENHTLYKTSDGAVWLNFSSRSWLLERRNFGHHNYEFQTIRFMPDSTPPKTYVSIASKRFPQGSQIQIQFSGADYWDTTEEGDLVYSYSLDGNEWTPFSTDSSVTISDVPYGDYIFRVRARDMDGNMDTTPAQVAFSVIPPIWQQAWFILLVLAVVLLILFLLYTLYRIRIKAALALDEFKLDFFTNISHELRNPLAVIISPIQMLLESDVDSNSRRRWLQIVLQNARKMQGMIDQLLQFRKMEKALWKVNHECGEIIGFTKESVLNIEPLWRARNQNLEFRTSKDSFLCNFDSDILLKVIDNLISNAVKYSDEQTKILVKVNIQTIDDHDYYILVVEDNGVGIPLHEQKNVLQPFYRINQNSEQRGAGVGLALVNQLVNLWGGTIEITSPLDEQVKGTRMTVKLPLEPYDDSEMEDVVDPHNDDAVNNRPVLLVVEDNKDMRLVLHDAFHNDYDVIESGDGLIGYELAQNQNPDIIVSDVMMPGMDGFELCEKIKSNPDTSHIPVILLTAKSSIKHRIEGIHSGADAYISKPLDVNHLRARIENLLESRHELRLKFAKQLVIEATEITVAPTDELIISKAIKIVEDNMQDEDFDVHRFGELMGMSRSTMKRKLKAITGLSPKPFMQTIRLKRAAKLLKSSQLTVSEVAAAVGFYDLSYFGKVFKKEFGLSPSHFGDTED